jgi:hypothetical protein
MTSQNVWNVSLFEHFFKDLSHSKNFRDINISRNNSSSRGQKTAETMTTAAGVQATPTAEITSATAESTATAEAT